MSRIRSMAALSGIVAMIAAVAIALPSQAATSTVWSVNFEDSTTGSWTQSGGGAGTLGYVDIDGSKALSVARTADYVGIQTPVGVLVPGTTYTFSMKARLAEGTVGTTALRFVGKPGYSWIGNTPAISASGWTTVTGEWTVPADADAAATQVYIGSADLSDGGGAAYTYLIDDLAVTTEVADTCTPDTVTLSGANFEDGTLGDWTPSGVSAGSLAYPTDGTKVLSVPRTADYVGIQSPVGIFEAGTTYTISAKVKLAADTAGSISARFVMKPAYSWIGNTSAISAAGWTTVTGEYTVAPDADTSALQLYIGTSDLSDGGGATYTYLVDDLSVTYQSECSDGPAPGTVAINTDFESGLDGWGPRDNGTGAPTVATTSDDAHGGTNAALVSDRTSQGSGIRHEVDGLLVPGTTYELTAWLKFAGTPSEDVWLSLENHSGGSTSYSTLAQFTGITSSGWVQVTQQFTMPTTDEAYLYFETKYENGDTGNTTSFLVDDISVVVPVPPVIQDLTPIKDTADFNVGVAIDNRETLGSPSDLVKKHFNQITPENYMKPEAWYNADGEFDPNSAQIDPLMTFAKANNIAIYGHVLVWHSQTPAWFFNKSFADPTPLTNSEADKAILRDRLATHIHNVARYLHAWGDFGGGNPVKAFDVVNEVVNDGASPSTNGLRDSRWYQVLGEEFIGDAFRDADLEFNHTFAADGIDRPVKLFINDYNTEQSGKRERYLALVDRLLADGVPVDGIGHQFHVSLATPVSALDEALTAASGRTAVSGKPMVQAVTEFDVPTGTPESTAKFIDQGYYFRDAFNVFRSHGDLFSVTVWGLNDARSWRDSSGGPLIFDDGFQAKPAYYGIVEGHSDETPLPARIRTAISFAEPSGGATAADWKLLPLLPAGDHASFQTRWASDHLAVYVTVDDATADPSDAVTVQVGDTDYSLARSGGELGTVTEGAGGYTALLDVPLTAAALAGTVQFDVRTTDGSTTSGWNDAGALGTLTFVEALSHTDIPEAAIAPVIDGTLDPVWSTSDAVQTIKQVSGSNGAIGTFHLLWKGQTLYVYAVVADPTVDTTGSDPWTKDSVEIYVDGGNAKNGSYRYDDTQIRINADNGVSFGTGDETYQANRLQSAAQHVDGGYVVEAAINLLEYGGLDSIQGLDVQVNDASGGARTAIRNWADPTGTGYQTTARWGVATLVEGTLIDQSAFAPAINGAAIVGRTLNVTGLPAGATLSYQWLRNGSVISGATHATYKLVAADGGAKLSVRVTSALAGYNDLTETSATTVAVLKTFTKVTAPSISGTAKVGSTLKAKISAWSPAASYKYQWYSNGKAIAGKTGSTLKLTRFQAGTTVTVQVTGSRSGYLSVAKLSAGKKVPLLTLHVGASHLNGPTKVGGTLRVTPGASSPVATVKSYQWYANGTVISGATSSTYKLKQADLGKRVTAKVTYKATGYAPKVVVVGPTFRIAAAR